MHINQGFNGIKSDIFSLGVTLFKLVTNHFPFNLAYKVDKWYKLIIDHEYDIYWENMKKTKSINVSELFKELFVKMVDFEENERPNIEKILSYKWFEEINNLSDEEKIQLEKEYISEFKNIEDSMKDQLNCTEEVEPKQMKPESLNEKLFNNEYKIISIDDEKIFDNYIKFKGNLNHIVFMNDFANEIGILFDGNIIIIDKEFKFNAIKKLNNFERNNKDLDFENSEEIIKDLNIQVELYKNKNGEFILNFIKKEGDLNDYYTYLIRFIKYAKDFI